MIILIDLKILDRSSEQPRDLNITHVNFPTPGNNLQNIQNNFKKFNLDLI